MNRPARWIAAAVVAVVALGVVAVSVHYRMWGGIALLAVAAAAVVWYRVQVQRAEETDQFFGDFGEETRLTAFQGNSPSEMPVDAAARAHPAQEPPRGA
jgi:apolipoprotein N-acyltransferase